MTADFWLFLGIGLMFACIGYGCDGHWNVEADGHRAFYQACADRIAMGYDVPDACRPLVEGRREDRLK